MNFGVYRGIRYFLIHALKYTCRLWVPVPTIYVLSKNKKNVTLLHLKIIIFTAVKYRSLLYGRVIVMVSCLSDGNIGKKNDRIIGLHSSIYMYLQ